MGKNKPKEIISDNVSEKTQNLEETDRISKGFKRDNPKKSK